MIGKFNIDGIDAYERFGVFISDAGLVSLLQYPPLKKVDSNDWPEEDGEEFDLSEPTLDTKTVQVKLPPTKQTDSVRSLPPCRIPAITTSRFLPLLEHFD